ncbi:MmgE/PrpD family protein [Ruicaihuangia caeni]|uniref:MmgE/PrpD family protein n=1 Tax=Ruicaihuangia caeni TaxID=3042517 RepID=A0AAW6TAJ1_9MICO|nr:MmgE/PrpD family protein [Klugiella sp. YN-L-19]MDI2099085.1 MmgE/PrpD family protein [Klugiella sp. YN-L-19]
MENTKTPVATIAEWVHRIRYEDLPTEVIAKAKLHILDTLGCAMGGAGTPVGRAILAATHPYSFSGSVSVMGLGRNFSAIRAAFVHGALAHVLDFDDTHPRSSCHVSAVSFPAALALAEYDRLSGKDLLLAYVIGVEVTAKIGSVVPGGFHVKGFHPTSVLGVFGAAAAAAKLAGLDVATTKHALGIAGSFSSGTFAFLSNGATVKPIHAGNAARSGIEAANLAESGITGPETILDGRDGIFSVYLGIADADFSGLDGLGTEWETLKLGIKAYPTCHATHSAIEAVSQLRTEHGFAPEDVESVRALVRERDVPLVVEPLEGRRRPTTTAGARFSLPYTVATALLDGKVEQRHFTEDVIASGRTNDLVDRFEWTVEPYADSDTRFPGGVEVTLSDGRRLRRVVVDEPGSLTNPLATERILEKFRSNAASVLSAGAVDATYEAVMRLDELADATELSDLLTEQAVPIATN